MPLSSLARRVKAGAAASATQYSALLSNKPFRRLWLGFSVSALGDALTQLALVWLVYDLTKSPTALATFLFWYTAPVLVGGFFVGSLLDRFERRNVIILDNLFRGSAVAAIPLLHSMATLQLWHIYSLAAIYSFLKMVPLAGAPAMIPSLVPEEGLSTANAMESLGYTTAGIMGPLLGGFVLISFGATNALWIDAASYYYFAWCMARIPKIAKELQPGAGGGAGWREPVQLLLTNRIILATTGMFMLFNTGSGVLYILLPIIAAGAGASSALLLGAMMSTLAVGEMSGALIAGSLRNVRLGLGICLLQTVSGLAILGLCFGRALWIALPCLLVLGAASTPLTIFAQTLRMRCIPADQRGRTFALLRTLMQGSAAAAAAFGPLISLLGVSATIALSGGVVGLPGLFGLQVRELREAH